MKRLLIVVLAASATLACGPDAQPAAAPSASQYPPYTGGETLLLDDTFAPEVFGMALGTADDDNLVQRAQHAESIELVRVATVTRQGDTTTPEFTLVLVPVPPPLAGAGGTEPLTVEVVADSPSYPLVRVADQDLVGKRFILLSRRYDDAGHVALHWRGVPDTKAVRAAIGKARALHELE